MEIPPPRAPNFGGLWEAGVKSFKFYLKRVVGLGHLKTVVLILGGFLYSEDLSTVGLRRRFKLSHSLFRITDIEDTFIIMTENMAEAADFRYLRSSKRDQELILRTGNKNITEFTILLENSEKSAYIPKSNQTDRQTTTM
ncbi:hypothetical protein TNCV_379941 [Trichonephila clavipes]|nr:hypothetical protein TNCV_379941 [Trichonephila clavipes]